MCIRDRVEGPAKQAGIMKGDKIVALNGKTIRFYDEFSDALKGKKNQTVVVDVFRNNAVSYTHLDVYKRQNLYFRTFLSCS